MTSSSLDTKTIQWPEHLATIQDSLMKFKGQEMFTDVKVSCDGNFFSAHRLVLASCSKFFEGAMEPSAFQHTVILLHGIKASILRALLTYMYCGEVTINIEDYELVVEAGRWLQVKGLTELPPIYKSGIDAKSDLTPVVSDSTKYSNEELVNGIKDGGNILTNFKVTSEERASLSESFDTLSATSDNESNLMGQEMSDIINVEESQLESTYKDMDSEEIRPIRCNQCSQSFTSHDEFMSHISTHISCLSCPICDQVFKKGDFKSHMSLHVVPKEVKEKRHEKKEVVNKSKKKASSSNVNTINNLKFKNVEYPKDKTVKIPTVKSDLLSISLDNIKKRKRNFLEETKPKLRKSKLEVSLQSPLSSLNKIDEAPDSQCKKANENKNICCNKEQQNEKIEHLFVSPVVNKDIEFEHNYSSANKGNFSHKYFFSTKNFSETVPEEIIESNPSVEWISSDKMSKLLMKVDNSHIQNTVMTCGSLSELNLGQVSKSVQLGLSIEKENTEEVLDHVDSEKIKGDNTGEKGQLRQQIACLDNINIRDYTNQEFYEKYGYEKKNLYTYTLCNQTNGLKAKILKNTNLYLRSKANKARLQKIFSQGIIAVDKVPSADSTVLANSFNKSYKQSKDTGIQYISNQSEFKDNIVPANCKNRQRVPFVDLIQIKTSSVLLVDLTEDNDEIFPECHRNEFDTYSVVKKRKADTDLMDEFHRSECEISYAKQKKIALDEPEGGTTVSKSSNVNFQKSNNYATADSVVSPTSLEPIDEVILSKCSNPHLDLTDKSKATYAQRRCTSDEPIVEIAVNMGSSTQLGISDKCITDVVESCEIHKIMDEITVTNFSNPCLDKSEKCTEVDKCSSIDAIDNCISHEAVIGMSLKNHLEGYIKESNKYTLYPAENCISYKLVDETSLNMHSDLDLGEPEKYEPVDSVEDCISHKQESEVYLSEQSNLCLDKSDEYTIIGSVDNSISPELLRKHSKSHANISDKHSTVDAVVNCISHKLVSGVHLNEESNLYLDKSDECTIIGSVKNCISPELDNTHSESLLSKSDKYSAVDAVENCFSHKLVNETLLSKQSDLHLDKSNKCTVHAIESSISEKEINDTLLNTHSDLNKSDKSSVDLVENCVSHELINETFLNKNSDIYTDKFELKIVNSIGNFTTHELQNEVALEESSHKGFQHLHDKFSAILGKTSSEFLNSKFCFQCGAIFHKTLAFDHHLESGCCKNRCPNCDMSFGENTEALHEHVNIMHRSVPFQDDMFSISEAQPNNTDCKCAHCGFVSTKLLELYEHYQEMHNERNK